MMTTRLFRLFFTIRLSWLVTAVVVQATEVITIKPGNLRSGISD